MVSANNAINNQVGASISGVTNTLTITNPSNTASSAARTTITVGGSSSADPTLNFNVSGVTDWEMGIDNTSSDQLKISQGTSLGTNDTWIMTTDGERTMPLQPAFLVNLDTTAANETGDGTLYTIAWDDEIFDQNGDFDIGTSTFTAPVTGKYVLSLRVRASNLTASSVVDVRGRISTSNNQVNVYNNTASGTLSNDGPAETASILVDMDAGDTATATFVATGGSKTVSIVGTSLTAFNTYFSGYLCV